MGSTRSAIRSFACTLALVVYCPAFAQSTFRTYTWPNGDRYEGEWIGNVRSGTGKYSWAANGDYYQGTWRDNRMIDGKIFDNRGVLVGSVENGTRGGHRAPAGFGWFPVGSGCSATAPSRDIDLKGKWTWDGPCRRGYADGVGTFRAYDTFGRVIFIARGEYLGGVLNGGETYVRPGGMGRVTRRSATGGHGEVMDVPAWAQDIIGDRPLRPTIASSPPPASSSSEPEQNEDEEDDTRNRPSAGEIWGQVLIDAMRQREERRRGRTPSSPPSGVTVPSREREPVASRLPEPSRGSDGDEAPGSRGEWLRGIVKMRFNTRAIHPGTPPHLEFVVYVAGRGEAGIKNNADAVARLFVGNSTWEIGGVQSTAVIGGCSGAGYVAWANILMHDAPTGLSKTRTDYVACFRSVDQRVVSKLRELERDVTRTARYGWGYEAFHVAYIDERNYRDAAQAEAYVGQQKARGGWMMRNPTAAVLEDRYKAQCPGYHKENGEIADLDGCLRQATGTLRSRLGI